MSDEQEERVIIEEPPIEKLTSKRSCLHKTCFNACGCLVLVIVFSLLFLKFEARPREKKVEKLPQTITETVPLYDKEQIFSISLNPGQERQKRTELLTFFPKLIVSPFIVHFPHRLGDKGPYTVTSTKKEIFYGFMRTPIGEQKDIYTLKWKTLSAEPQFIAEYYQTEMEKAGFTEEYNQTNHFNHQLLYRKDSTLVNIVIIEKSGKKDVRKSSLTEEVTMTVSL